MIKTTSVPADSSCLNFMIWNMTSARYGTKTRYLSSVLSEHKVNVALIQETFFMADEDFYARGYILFRAGSKTQHRKGVMILVSTNLKVDIETVLSDSEGRYLTISLKDRVKDTKTPLYCVYLEPRSGVELPAVTLGSDVLAGDTNSR